MLEPALRRHEATILFCSEWVLRFNTINCLHQSRQSSKLEVETKFLPTLWSTNLLPHTGPQVHDKRFFLNLFTRQRVTKGVEAHSTAADLRQRPLAHSALDPNISKNGIWHVE